MYDNGVVRQERITVQSIRQKIQNEADAYVYLEDLRWGNHPVCAHCGSERVNLLNPANGISRLTRTKKTASQRRVWKCYACRKQFSVTTGTIMHGSKVSLEIWVFILFEMCANKDGLAAREIERKYGLTAKTAWFITQRIREAMKREPLAGLLSATIVADQTLIGGKPGNRHRQGVDRLPSGKGARRNNNRGGTMQMTPVLSIVDKQTGEVRSQVVPDVTGKTIRRVIAEQVDIASSVLHTDRGAQYRQLGQEFLVHEWVDHGAYEDVRGEVSTNRLEGCFSQLKRSIDGTHHHVSPAHPHRYLAEFDYRYSTRGLSDTQRTNMLLGHVGGKRLTCKPLRTGP